MIENPTCGWDDISKISEKYDINTRLGKFERPFNATNATMLEAGDNVELKCSDSVPVRRPVVDSQDDDKMDGIITIFCMSPQSTGVLGRYAELMSLLKGIHVGKHLLLRQIN